MRTRRLSALALQFLFAMGCSRSPVNLLDADLEYQRVDGGKATMVIRGLQNRSQESIVLVSVGRGLLREFPDSRFHPQPAFQPLGQPHPYTLWRESGTALYYRSVAATEAIPEIRVATFPRGEITVSAVAIAGSRVQDFSWTEALREVPVTSKPVITTGPATLVAFWWGDADVREDKTSVPNNGFKVVHSILKEGALVQCAVAVKHVEAAGAYDVTWTATPRQGAQLWLVAIE